MLAIEKGSLKIVELLVDKGADVNYQTKNDFGPLKKAVECQQNKMAMLFLKNGVDPNTQDENGITPLMVAREPDMADLLLENGAKLVLQDKTGKTALFHMVKEKCYAASDVLLRRGANPKVKLGTYQESTEDVLKQESTKLVSVISSL